MKKIITFLSFILLICCTLRGADIEGYWQVVDGGKPQSIVFVYEHGGFFYMRMIAIYEDGKVRETIADPKEASKGIDGAPKICGLDFIWNLRPEGEKFVDGKVIDPDDGKVFDCEAWYDSKKNALIMRGKLLIFHEDEHWPRLEPKDVPKEAHQDPKKITPKVYGEK